MKRDNSISEKTSFSADEQTNFKSDLLDFLKQKDDKIELEFYPHQISESYPGAPLKISSIDRNVKTPLDFDLTNPSIHDVHLNNPDIVLSYVANSEDTDIDFPHTESRDNIPAHTDQMPTNNVPETITSAPVNLTTGASRPLASPTLIINNKRIDFDLVGGSYKATEPLRLYVEPTPRNRPKRDKKIEPPVRKTKVEKKCDVNDFIDLFRYACNEAEFCEVKEVDQMIRVEVSAADVKSKIYDFFKHFKKKEFVVKDHDAQSNVIFISDYENCTQNYVLQFRSSLREHMHPPETIISTKISNLSLTDKKDDKSEAPSLEESTDLVTKSKKTGSKKSKSQVATEMIADKINARQKEKYERKVKENLSEISSKQHKVKKATPPSEPKVAENHAPKTEQNAPQPIIEVKVYNANPFIGIKKKISKKDLRYLTIAYDCLLNIRNAFEEINNEKRSYEEDSVTLRYHVQYNAIRLFEAITATADLLNEEDKSRLRNLRNIFADRSDYFLDPDSTDPNYFSRNKECLIFKILDQIFIPLKTSIMEEQWHDLNLNIDNDLIYQNFLKDKMLNVTRPFVESKGILSIIQGKIQKRLKIWTSKLKDVQQLDTDRFLLNFIKMLIAELGEWSRQLRRDKQYCTKYFNCDLTATSYSKNVLAALSQVTGKCFDPSSEKLINCLKDLNTDQCSTILSNLSLGDTLILCIEVRNLISHDVLDFDNILEIPCYFEEISTHLVMDIYKHLLFKFEPELTKLLTENARKELDPLAKSFIPHNNPVSFFQNQNHIQGRNIGPFPSVSAQPRTNQDNEPINDGKQEIAKFEQ